MAEDWDFYICQVDSKPASIYLNLKAADDAAVAANPYSAYVRVFMRYPREDGLSSNEEFDQLVVLEDALIDGLAAAKLASFVGRITSDGCRDLYFYAQHEAGIEPAVHAVMAGFADYEYETGGRPEADWDTYLNFLYPTAEDYQRIQNRRVCQALADAGDEFTDERPVEHWVYFKAEEAQLRFIRKALQMGFKLEQAFGPTAEDARFTAQLSCDGIPSFADIDALTIPLFRLAEDCDGDYDGWETQVVKVDG